jgi:LysM repeat protein
VAAGCSGVSYTNDWGTVYPITEFADTLLFNFHQTCLKNEGKYCNIVLGNLTKNGGDDCNKCLLLKLRNEAKYPYGSGPDVYSSAYPSYTSSCGFTGYPVTASPTMSLPHMYVNFDISPKRKLMLRSSSTSASSVAATPTASTCSGKKYTIKDGDTCESVSKSQSVATFQLLMDNQLQAYCANFPKSGNLCIQNQCTTYTVRKGDTCKSISKEHNITTVQLRSYNPWIDGGCYNFNRTIGTEICMDEPGEKYHAPSSVVSATGSPTASSAVPVPTNLAQNSTKNCGEYYTPKSNETCDTIVQNFPISRGNFLILNPGLNQK